MGCFFIRDHQLNEFQLLNLLFSRLYPEGGMNISYYIILSLYCYHYCCVGVVIIVIVYHLSVRLRGFSCGEKEGGEVIGKTVGLGALVVKQSAVDLGGQPCDFGSIGGIPVRFKSCYFSIT